MRYFNWAGGVTLVCLILCSCLGIQAQTLDENYASNGVLNSLAGFHARTHLLQDKLIVAIMDENNDNVRLRSYNADGSQNVSFQNIGMNIPYQNVSQGGVMELQLKEANTDEFIYLGYMDRVAGGFDITDQFRCGIARFDSDGELSTGFATNGVFDYLVTPQDYMVWNHHHLGLEIDNNIIATAGWYRNVSDSLVIIQTDLDGQPNTSFGSNGIARYKLSTLFETGYIYEAKSWAFVNGECYILVKGTIIGGSDFFGKILRIDATGNVVGTPIDATSYFNGNTSPILSYKLGNFYFKISGSIEKIDISGETVQTITSYSFPSGWNHEFVVDGSGNHYLLGSSSPPAPFIGVCYRYTNDGALDTSFGQSGILSYSTSTDVDGVVFTNAIITSDALFIACEIGDIATPSGQQNVAILKYSVSNPNNVAENQEQGLSVYPNPARDQISIFNASEGTIQILTNDGRLVQSQQIISTATTTSIDVSHLPSGIYFINHKGKTSSRISKFVKQ
jgi:hypothetical protein